MWEKIAKLRRLREANLWAIGAMWGSILFGESPYFQGFFLICCVTVITLGSWRAIWARKLLRCPYCLRYSPVEVEKFLRGKEETFPCPHCGKQIPVMDKEQE